VSDFLSLDDINSANPGGVPLGVDMPGGTPFAVPGSNAGNPISTTNNNISGATLGSGIQGSVITTPGGGQSVPSSVAANPTAQASVTPPSSTSAGPAAGSLADYFARGIIIILGFIFIAVGLDMLKPGVVPSAVNPRRFV
jgi:hypothetical protein